MKFLGGGGSWQNFAKNLIIQEGAICPEMLIQQLVELLTAVTRKSLTGWSRLMDHRKSERVVF
jgi:hypothetical protein